MARRKPAPEPVTVDAAEPAAEWVPIAELKPWSRNPRKNDPAVKRVADSIKRFGFGAPVLARKADHEIIAGHTRVKAAETLGIDRVPVRYLDLDPADAHLLALADNKLSEIAEWDNPALASVLSDYGLDDVALAGWDSGELDALADGFLPDDGEVTEDEAPEPPKDPVTKPGDLWVLGEHRLLCGDCRVADDMARLCDGERVNVAFTSPPYASQRKYDESSGFKPIPPDDYVDWFEPVQANVRDVRDVLAADGSWFVNIKEHCEDGQRHLYVKDLTIAHVRRWDWRFVDEFCWTHGGTPAEVRRRFKNGWEPVAQYTMQHDFKFRPHDVRHASERVPGVYADAKRGRIDTAKSQGVTWDIFANDAKCAGLAFPSNTLHTWKNSGSLGHSAAFPVALPTFFVKAYSDPGDRILDPFMGSGTVLVAAEQNERCGLGTEISPAYCDVIVERWQNLTGGKAERRNH